MSDAARLAIRDLAVSFAARSGRARAVEGVSLTIEPGETVGLVGESGCGKSLTSLAILRLLPPAARIESGSIHWRGRDLLTLPEKDLRSVRGREIAMVFQEPMTSLNPVLRVGDQVEEAITVHEKVPRGAARDRAVALLTRVGIPAAGERIRDYPHQLSGGMRQRVMIAMALACDPALLLADEPTTALDVTVQAGILDLLRDLQRERGMAVLLITHDLGVVAETARRVAVMYAGRIVEEAPVDALFARPLHPYTQALLASLPHGRRPRSRLAAIPGTVPSPEDPPPGCRFAPRCPIAVPECSAAEPPLEEKAAGHRARCILVAPEGARAPSR